MALRNFPQGRQNFHGGNIVLKLQATQANFSNTKFTAGYYLEGSASGLEGDTQHSATKLVRINLKV